MMRTAALELDQSVQLELGPRISPKLIASIKILALSSQELAQTIAQEARENPALEVEELPQCPHCGELMEDGRCLNCSANTQQTEASAERSDWDSQDYAEPLSNRATNMTDEEYDPMSRVLSEETLIDHLLLGLAATIDDEDQPIAEYLVGNLDERGYLKIEIEEVALAVGVSIARVETVLAALQNLEPAGVGARDVRECMLIQVRALAEQGISDPYAEEIVKCHLKTVAERRWQEVASRLGTTSFNVRESFKFIKQYLNPFPANSFRPTGGRPARNFKPDVIIRRTPSGTFEVEVIEASRFDLRIDSTYRMLSNGLGGAARGMSDDDRGHIKEHVARARFFIDCIRQRWETLRQITSCLVDYQRDFLHYGVRHLRPLTRSELADMVGLHESTISRATADKFVMLPSGRSIPFHDFFDASLSIKDTMKEFIKSETEEGPLSDQQIAEKLAGRELHIARRTVAKYRDALGIPPSRYR